MSQLDRKAGPFQALLLLIGSCLPILGTVLLAPVLPRMQAHFSEVPGVAFMAPIALTIPALMIALLAPFAGTMVDRLGRKPLLVWSLLVYAICGLLPLWLESLEAIIASRAGLGLAEAGIMTCCTTLIGDYFQGKHREKVLALQMVATSLSAAIFIAIGGILGQDDWRVPFVVYGVGLLILPFMATYIWEPSAQEPAAALKTTESFPWGALIPLYILTVFAGVSLFIVPVQAGFLLNLLHVDSPQQVGITMGSNQLGFLVGALSFRLLVSVKRQNLMLIAFGVAGAGGWLMSQAVSHPVMVVAVFINGLGIGLMLPTLITWVMSYVSFALRGRATGGFTSALFAGEFISPLVVIAINGGKVPELPAALAMVAAAQLVLALSCLALPRVFRSLTTATPSVS